LHFGSKRTHGHFSGGRLVTAHVESGPSPFRPPTVRLRGPRLPVGRSASPLTPLTGCWAQRIVARAFQQF
jgi:hypothetical protein